MKTKVLNIIQVLLIPIFWGSLFVPMFKLNFYDDYYKLEESHYLCFYEMFGRVPDLGLVLLLIICLFFAITSNLLTIYMGVSLLSDSQKFAKFFSASKKLIIKEKIPITYLLSVLFVLCAIGFVVIFSNQELYPQMYHSQYGSYLFGYYNYGATPKVTIPLVISFATLVNCFIDSLIVRKRNKITFSVDEKTSSIELTETIIKNVSDNERTEKRKSIPDDLIKLKELLDIGLITQEEFDAKKKQILGL